MIGNRQNKFNVLNYNISNQEAAELFQKCSVVVLPYIDASQSGVILPAYAFKKPVVITDVGSIAETVDDGVTGFIVPPKDTEALAKAIIKLLNDAKLRKIIGNNAYHKLKTDLSWDIIAQKTMQVYQKALYNHRKVSIDS
jgi:glycosyltransferase involved in cell wall biosynthesis